VGLILDSSVLIAAERKGSNARQAMTAIARRVPSQDIAISVVTLMELAHGAARADTPERKALRLQFLREIAAAAPVHRITVPIALRAGSMARAQQGAFVSRSPTFSSARPRWRLVIPSRPRICATSG
jgi:predicted nucleic acid-binding protein